MVGVLVAACTMMACAPSETDKTVYLQDFLTPEAAQTDAVPALRAALERCAEVGATSLVLPGSTLHMRPDLAVEKYQFISNNDESLKRIAFDLCGLHDLTIEGNGTELLFTGFISPFNLEGCRNVTIRDLSIDFTRTFNSEGVVVGKGKGWLDIRFPEDFHFLRDHLDLSGHQLRIDRLGRTGDDFAVKPHDRLDAPAIERLIERAFRIDHHLGDPVVVAQIDEDHAAVVADTVNPAGEADTLADLGFAELSAGVGAIDAHLKKFLASFDLWVYLYYCKLI